MADKEFDKDEELVMIRRKRILKYMFSHSVLGLCVSAALIVLIVMIVVFVHRHKQKKREKILKTSY